MPFVKSTSLSPLFISAATLKPSKHYPFNRCARSRAIFTTSMRSTATAPESTATGVPRTRFAEKYGPWAVITGASSGIGAEFARQLAVSGLSLVLVARREDRLKTLAASLKATCNVDTIAVKADLTAPRGVDSVIAACKELDVGLLVNNAGVELHGSFFHHSMENHRNCLALNVTALTELAHAFGLEFCRRKRGGIVFVSSVSSRGMPYLATYSSSKAYVTTLALTLRDEFGKCGVDVMALEPGLVVSEMTVEPGQEGHDYGSLLMSTDVCVREALQVFGKRAVYTPGYTYKLLKALFALLPTTVAIWILGIYYKSVMDPKRFEPYRPAEDGKGK